MQHDYKVNSQHLLNEWYYYKSAKPKGHIFDIQADKDDLQQWATLLQTFLLCSDNITTIAEICFIFEDKLQKFKENIIIDLLRYQT